MVFEEFDGRFCKKNMNFVFDCIECDWVVSWVRCEDGNCIIRFELVNCSFIGIWVFFVVGGKGVEGGFEFIVNLCNVFVEVFVCLWYRWLLDYIDKEVCFEVNDVWIVGNLVLLILIMFRLLILFCCCKLNRVRLIMLIFLLEVDVVLLIKLVVYFFVLI